MQGAPIEMVRAAEWKSFFHHGQRARFGALVWLVFGNQLFDFVRKQPAYRGRLLFGEDRAFRIVSLLSLSVMFCLSTLCAVVPISESSTCLTCSTYCT